ncbi:unnamed protein product (macronuclear) [Paramecium tetraurelia]|uniref:TNFR-Cys domain-containing protein n=1 Tax=Paramecium tetraurelia TaxID=5888 RepID=A0DR54_PARTE|nr:uncharacterized protein GSPATT00002922001 [Paramecium tetraurelia]CAK85521.1 unnamed protein product [Paramecium tetraurelia]|eukprot:XP_001452918.1 hypothetical protein (macronuclear) [Paramecium tetraurelia strain d4-2]
MQFLLILPFVSSFSIKMDDALSGAITKYTLDVQLSIDTYNSILMIFPLSYELNELMQIYCWCNGNKFQAKIKDNQILIFGNFIPSYTLNITLENIENGYYPFNQDKEYILEFYQDENLVERQTCLYTLAYQQQLSIQGRYENYSTFVKTTLNFEINFLFRVRAGTIFDIIFPIINIGATKIVSMLTQDTFPLFQNISLDFEINLAEQKLTIYNLFQKQYLPGNSILLSIHNIYTNNQQLDGDSFWILYKTTYKGLNIAEGQFQENEIKSVSPSKEFTLESSNQFVSQYTQLFFSFVPRLAYRQGSQIYIKFLNLQQQSQISQTIFLPKQNINPNYEFYIENEGIVIKNFNQFYESMKFQFCLQDIMNPTGLSTFNIGFYVLTPERNQVEYQELQIEILPQPISYITIEATNTTVFAITDIVIKFELKNVQTKSTTLTVKIPRQIQITRDSVLIQPDLQQDIQINGQEIIFKNYFNNHQIMNQVEITFSGKLQGTAGITDNFLIFTNDYSGALISLLQKPAFLTIQPSKYLLISLNPQIYVTDYLTNYLIKFQIPQIQEQSVLTVELPIYFKQQLSFCSAQIETNQQICEIGNNKNITVTLFVGGILEIIIYNIKTERSIQQYSYQVIGDIKYQQQIQSTQQNQLGSYKILFPQTFYDYSLTSSNSFYGELTTLQFSFNLLSTIQSNDLLQIVFPINIEKFLSCSNIVEKQIGQEIYLKQLQNGTNTFLCELFNPIDDVQIYPFQFNIFTDGGDIIAVYQDAFGIRDELRANKIDFSIKQQSFFLNEVTNITLNFHTNLGVQKYGKIKAIFQLSQIIVLDFKCILQINQTQELKYDEVLCESYLENENLIVISNFVNSIQSNFYQLIFTGLTFVGHISDYETNITLQNINQFGKIVEESQRIWKFSIICSENCKICDKKYNQCIKCKEGFIQFQNICIEKCPPNMILTSQGCEKCLTDANCLQCDYQNITQCIKCINEFQLKDGYCLKFNTSSNSNSNNHTNQNSSNNPNQNDHSISNLHSRQSEIYDGAPIFVIIMVGMLLAVIVNKIIKQKDALIIKTYYIYISLLDIPIAITRFIRFTLLQFPGYYILSLSCLAVTFFVQILNSSQLQLLKKTNLTFFKIISTSKLKEQLATLFQWRIILSILPNQIETKVLNEIKKLFYNQTISQILPIIVQISFMCNQNKFYFFSLDDIVYNIIMIALSSTNNLWLILKIKNLNQIHPELRDQSICVQGQEQAFREEDQVNNDDIIYYRNQPKINEQKENEQEFK